MYIVHKDVEAETLNNPDCCPMLKTQIMIKLCHHYWSAIEYCCFNMNFVLGGACCCQSATSLIVRCPNSTAFEV
jgi:hypothetical protein